MKRNLTRLFGALMISTICYLGTELWFRSSKHSSHSSDGKAAIARIHSANNEVQRKEVKRVIWETVTLNDDLFAGEAIRTTDNAEAEILLKKNGTTIHLDPDSLVVLEENASGLALDFLQGNLYVQSSSSSAPGANGLTLKTGSGEIKLNSADMSLSKDKSGQVNLEVFKGNAELQQGTKKMAIGKDGAAVLTEKGISENKDRLQLLAPLTGETVMVNVSKAEQLTVSWKPLTADYQVSLELGPARATMNRIANLNANGDAGTLKTLIKPGKWYLRVIAQSQDKSKPQLVSSVARFTVEPKAPPTLVEPSSDHPYAKESPEEEIEFKWLPRNHYFSQLLEIAQDKTFKKPINQKRLDGNSDTFSLPLNDGTYYWRVTGYLQTKGTTEALTSPSAQLQITSHVEIKAASLIYPPAKGHVPVFETQKSGLTFKWQAPSGVERFKILAEVKRDGNWKSIYDQETATTSLQLNDLNSGSYRWKVTSIDSKGNPGPSTELSEFTIDDMPKLEWVRTDKEELYEFTTPTPSLRAQWKELPGGAALYRFRVSPEGDTADSATWSTTKLNNFDIPLKSEGKYVAIVEALNQKNQPIAQSDSKSFVVKHLALLPPPKWAENSPEVLKANQKGDLSFSWMQVEGAKGYMMVLENEAGQVVDRRSISRTTASVSHLKPGQYSLKLRSIDAYKRPGDESSIKKLQVPTTSDIKAPKIKAMKVK